MADDLLERTLPPTLRRREQARQRGEIARSADLVTAGLLLGIVIILKELGPRLVAVMEELLRASLSQQRIMPSIRQLANSLGLVIAGAVVIALIANVAQVGLRFRLPSRRNRFGSFQQRARSAGSAFPIAVFKLAVVLTAAWTILRGQIEQILVLAQAPLSHIPHAGGAILYAAGVRIALAMLAVGAVDYALQMFRLHQRQKMTRREMQEELRQTEGDPRIKAKRRAIQELRALSRPALERSRTLQPEFDK
jgi:flagellar biosynthetic protein FlhB